MITIGPHNIGSDYPPYYIAEISCNHGGSLPTALSLIRHAKTAGANAVKFQCYEADTITLDCDRDDFIVKDGPWKGRNLHALYQKAQTPFAWFPDLFAQAEKTGITIFASVFDFKSVDILEGLGCPAYKIASMEITDTPLIRYAAETGKPLIISTGMANKSDIVEAVDAALIHDPDHQELALLHCVSSYPTRIEDSNLYKIRQLMGYRPDAYGISDHSLGANIPIAAVAMGASIIEKHLMVGTFPTEDFAFSHTPEQFKDMVECVDEIWRAMRPSKSGPDNSSRQMRRSLYVVRDMVEGEAFTAENVRSIRPAYGMPPGMLSWVLTKTATRSLTKGTPLKLSDIISGR